MPSAKEWPGIAFMPVAPSQVVKLDENLVHGAASVALRQVFARISPAAGNRLSPLIDQTDDRLRIDLGGVLPGRIGCRCNGSEAQHTNHRAAKSREPPNGDETAQQDSQDRTAGLPGTAIHRAILDRQLRHQCRQSWARYWAP